MRALLNDEAKSGFVIRLIMVAFVGSLATINRGPGQARKGAAETVDLCAEM